MGQKYKRTMWIKFIYQINDVEWSHLTPIELRLTGKMLSPRLIFKFLHHLIRPMSPLLQSGAHHYHLCYNRAVFTITTDFNLTSETVKCLFMFSAFLLLTFSEADHFCCSLGLLILISSALSRVSLIKNMLFLLNAYLWTGLMITYSVAIIIKVFIFKEEFLVIFADNTQKMYLPLSFLLRNRSSYRIKMLYR